MSSITALLKLAKYIMELKRVMRKKWQDLPDELILKILSYSEVEDLISCGQVSKRTRNISQDSSLWVTVNLEKKIVKTELLELILRKGCKILNISDSSIVGCLGSNIKSQLRVLTLSQSAWGFPVRDGPVYDIQGRCMIMPVYYKENIAVLEELLFSCCSLEHLKIVGLHITPKMAVSICKNGKTLQELILKSSFVEDRSIVGRTYPHSGQEIVYSWFPHFQEIIKCCQKLIEVDIDYTTNGVGQGLWQEDLEFLVKNITTKIEKINLWNHSFDDDHVKILLSRCNKIKALSLDTYSITDNSLTYIRQYLYLTLQELSLVDHHPGCHHLSLMFDGTQRPPKQRFSFTSFLELKSMQKLEKINLYNNKDDDVEIQNLRQHLPHIKISGDISYPFDF